MSVKAPSSVPSPKPVPPTPTPTPVLPPPRPSPVPPKLQPPVDPPVLPPVSTPPPVPPPTSPPIPPPPKPSPPPPPDLSPTPPPDLPPPPPSNPSPPLPPDTPLLSPPQFLSPPPPYEPPPPQSAASPNTVSVGLIAGIAAGSVVFGAMVIVIFVLLFRRRKKDDEDAYDYPYIRPSPTPRGYPFVPGVEQKTIFDPQTPWDSLSSRNSKNAPGNRSGPDPTSSPKTPPPPSVPTAFGGGAYNYEELQLATNGLSELNVLGQGGFGVVYQGTLRGKEVAIKKLKTGGGQGDREFRTEVEVISRVHHRNLVSLEGYCIHEDQRLLVYEFVPNKTLDFHLHGSGRPTLDWLRRWKIALGSAKGLAYLHEDCHPKIIHRDIKAANILLDYHFEPKVADFGLAKLVPENVTHVSTQIMGTFGYLAPEYATSGQLTDRSDVYSYGVMLLELITGRKPVMGSDPNVDQSLVYWARPLLRRATKEEMCDELIDPWLENNYDQYDMARLIHCAAAAVRDSARMRPRMGQIVRYLEGEIALEDLNAGMMPGNSNVKVNSADEATLRRMAFGGVITEDYAESDRTSEYEPTASSSAYTEEMDDHRVNKKSSGEV